MLIHSALLSAMNRPVMWLVLRCIISGCWRIGSLVPLEQPVTGAGPADGACCSCWNREGALLAPRAKPRNLLTTLPDALRRSSASAFSPTLLYPHVILPSSGSDTSPAGRGTLGISHLPKHRQTLSPAWSEPAPTRLNPSLNAPNKGKEEFFLQSGETGRPSET